MRLIKNKIRYFLGCIIFGLIFSASLSGGLAQGGGNQGSGYQGQQPPQSNAKSYEFGNNMRVNMSSNVALNLDLQVDDALSDRFIAIAVNNSQAVSLQLQIQSSFSNPPQQQVQWQKNRHTSNPPTSTTSTTTTTSSGNSNQTNSTTSTQNPPGPGPHSLYDFTPFSVSSASINDLETTTSTQEITYDYHTYYLLTFNSTVDQLEISTILDPAWGFTAEADYVWLLYDNETSSWKIIETTQSGDSLTTQLDGRIFTQSQFILTIATLVPITPQPSFWESPTGIVVIIIGILALTIGLLMSQSEFRHYLFTRIVDIEKGAHRLTLEEVLENEKRDEIIRLILEMPGIHFNELLRQTDLAPGNLVWHLDILETFKIIRKQRVGQYLIYFPFLDKNPLSKLDLTLQKSKTTLEILQIINDHPGIYQNQLASRMDMNHKTIQYHLNKLTEAEIIRSEQKGRKRLWFPVYLPDSKIEDEKEDISTLNE
jgi:predicted transcriptional regulator